MVCFSQIRLDFDIEKEAVVLIGNNTLIKVLKVLTWVDTSGIGHLLTLFCSQQAEFELNHS